MSFTMKIERYEDDDEIDEDEYCVTLSMIIKMDEHILVRVEYEPMKHDDECSFTLFDNGRKVTVEDLKKFIEKFEQNVNAFINFKEMNGENSIVYSYNALYITNRHDDNFLQVAIPIDQNARANFVEGFNKLLDEIVDICDFAEPIQV